MQKKAFLCLVFSVLLIWGALTPALADEEVTLTILDTEDAQIPETTAIEEADPAEEQPVSGNASAGGDPAAREAFIDGIIAMAQKEYEQAGGKAHEAQYASSNYVCKNYTVYLFRENAGSFRMAEFPNVPLKIPDNKPREECTDYVYGVDASLSAEENRQKAREFLQQVQKGDYFQMAAKYYYGVGAHSMIFIADYDPDTDTVRWCDSNMKGEKRNGIRYGYLQFDAAKKIDWFVDAFCRKKYGATIYRLRDDIIRVGS